jgi:hypothetical protein
MKPTDPIKPTWPRLAGLLCLLAAPALAVDAAADPGRAQRIAPVESMPPDVAAFAERGVQCRAWLNTVIADAATDSRVERALMRLRCDRLAADSLALRHKYAQAPHELRALDIAAGAGP